MSCSLSLQLCIRFCNGSANQYQKRAGLKKPGRCKHTETEDGTVGCQLLVGRSLTKHLHHRPLTELTVLLTLGKMEKMVQLSDLYPNKIDILWRSEQLKSKDLAGPFL